MRGDRHSTDADRTLRQHRRGLAWFLALLGMTKRAGFLALILHAHLPFVRHPEHERFLEEEWLFEALTESYIPLLQMLQRLLSEDIPVNSLLTITETR